MPDGRVGARQKRSRRLVALIARVGATILGCWPIAEAVAAPDQSDDPSLVVTIPRGQAPAPGTHVDADKIPGVLETLDARALNTPGGNKLSSQIAARVPSVSLTSENGSPDQPDLDFRGFLASPVAGEAQGLAVYENGVRINEAFGDTVNWDLVPAFAVDQVTLQGSNPVFGLNALGGAVNLDMKTGFSFVGSKISIGTGSFGRVDTIAEYGRQAGNFGTYVGVNMAGDGGYREHSPSLLRRGYADLGARGRRLDLDLAVSGAWNDVRAAGPTPVEMLDRDQGAIFTYPQRYDNQDKMVTLVGTYHVNDTVTLNNTAYFRHFQQAIIDGNTTDAQACVDNAALLCLGGGLDSSSDLLFDRNGHAVLTPNLDPAQALGEIDYSSTRTTTLGDTLQATERAELFRHGNNLVVGGSFDHGSTNYQAYGSLAALQPSLLASDLGITIDQSFNPTASELIAPVNLDATNTYYGLYLSDTFDVTARLAVTLNGRYNLALINLADRIGNGLSGNHRYARFNPGGGLTYQITPLVTGYASYAEANRAPTPGELACANPAKPCALSAFLVADPELAQVVSRTVEAGLRGHFRLAALTGRFHWKAGVFQTVNTNDILLVGTPTNGFGYFTNAGKTRRRGIETSLAYRRSRWSGSLAYSLIDATYRTPLTLSSASPSADANGLITVAPGDRLPLIPRHRVTLTADFAVNDQWSIGGDFRIQSGFYLAGDNSNQQPPMAGYYTLNLHSDWQVRDWLDLSGEVENITGERYSTYGAFTQLQGLPARYAALSNPRTYTPGIPRSVYACLTARF